MRTSLGRSHFDLSECSADSRMYIRSLLPFGIVDILVGLDEELSRRFGVRHGAFDAVPGVLGDFIGGGFAEVDGMHLVLDLDPQAELACDDIDTLLALGIPMAEDCHVALERHDASRTGECSGATLALEGVANAPELWRRLQKGVSFNAFCTATVRGHDEVVNGRFLHDECGGVLMHV